MVLEYYGMGRKALSRVLGLFLVNVFLAFMSIDNIRRILEFNGFHIGFRFSLPVTIPTVWDFVEPPPTPPSHYVVSFWLFIALVSLVVNSVITYFYLRILMVRGLDYQPPSTPVRILDLILYGLIGLFFASIILVAGLAALILFPLIIILYYFIYATPYIIVAENKNIVEALATSIKLASTGTYLAYTLSYIAIVLLTSPILTLITVNTKLPGVIVGSLIAGIIGLWLTSSTTAMILDKQGLLEQKEAITQHSLPPPPHQGGEENIRSWIQVFMLLD